MRASMWLEGKVIQGPGGQLLTAYRGQPREYAWATALVGAGRLYLGKAAELRSAGVDPGDEGLTEGVDFMDVTDFSLIAQGRPGGELTEALETLRPVKPGDHIAAELVLVLTAPQADNQGRNARKRLSYYVDRVRLLEAASLPAVNGRARRGS